MLVFGNSNCDIFPIDIPFPGNLKRCINQNFICQYLLCDSCFIPADNVCNFFIAVNCNADMIHYLKICRNPKDRNIKLMKL